MVLSAAHVEVRDLGVLVNLIASTIQLALLERSRRSESEAD